MTAPGFACGRYRLEVSAELVAFVEDAFVLPLPPAERARARTDALRELLSSELLLEPDGTLVSRANGVEALRVRLAAGSLGQSTFSFEKAPGVEVRLERASDDVVIAFHPGKPQLTFRRA